MNTTVLVDRQSTLLASILLNNCAVLPGRRSVLESVVPGRCNVLLDLGGGLLDRHGDALLGRRIPLGCRVLLRGELGVVMAFRESRLQRLVFRKPELSGPTSDWQSRAKNRPKEACQFFPSLSLLCPGLPSHESASELRRSWTKCMGVLFVNGLLASSIEGTK